MNEFTYLITKDSRVIKLPIAKEDGDKIWVRYNDKEYLLSERHYDTLDEVKKGLRYKRDLDNECEVINDSRGDLDTFDGHECKKCYNRGYFAKVEKFEQGFYLVTEDCECMRVRNLIKGMKLSGLGDMLKIYKFANYIADESWQFAILQKAKNFVENPTSAFFIGGQVGGGKTHICTAIVGEFLKKGISSVKYVVWEEMSTLLKQEAYDDKTSYNERLEELKNCKILFIDDLFKTNPSLADIKNCFTIINYRYNLARSNADEKYITIISSEKTIAEITKLDEAIGTRIYELANGNLIAISKDSSKNFRTRGIIND